MNIYIYITFCARSHDNKQINITRIIIKIKLVYCSMCVYWVYMCEVCKCSYICKIYVISINNLFFCNRL